MDYDLFFSQELWFLQLFFFIRNFFVYSFNNDKKVAFKIDSF